jgi:hypothetical protein
VMGMTPTLMLGVEIAHQVNWQVCKSRAREGASDGAEDFRRLGSGGRRVDIDVTNSSLKGSVDYNPRDLRHMSVRYPGARPGE